MTKADGMISLACKAGKIVSGSFSVDKAIKAKTAKLVIIASDASDATKKDLMDACSFYKTDYIIYSNKDTLGAIIGKEFRVCLAVTDEKMAKAVLEKINNQ